MREEVRNLIIIFLLAIVIILSITNIGIRYTGKATTSNVNLTVSSNAKINFTVNNVNFGNGSVTSGNNATIDTLGNVINGNWTPTSTAFTIENAGSVNVTLDLKTDKNATTFLGGTNPAYKYNITDIEAGSCNSTLNQSQWYEVNITGDGTLVCNPLYFSDSQDSIRVDIRLIIPSDSQKGDLQSIFTATATSI